MAIDKAGLPTGSSIGAGGDITVPLGVAVTAISGITRNAAAFANSGQFALSGNNLIVSPSRMIQPASGVTDSYVVTVANQDGSTTLVTVSVSHGSVRVISIVVSVGTASDITPPVTISAPGISIAATDTTVSVTQTINENGTGYYLILPAEATAPTVAAVKAGTSFSMFSGIQAVVNLNGLTANKSYKYYFVAKDSANNDQAAVSSGLLITTTTEVVTPTLNAVLLPNGGDWGTGSMQDITISNATAGADWAVEDITPGGPVVDWLSPTTGTGDGVVRYLVKGYTEGKIFTVRIVITKNSLSNSYILTAPHPIW